MGGLKPSQKGPATNGFVKSNNCVAVEALDWIDGINNPDKGRNQIHGPGTKPFEGSISYTFSTFDKRYVKLIFLFVKGSKNGLA
jgi:aldose 1-epimerase